MIFLSYLLYRMKKIKFSIMAGWFRAPESGSMAGWQRNNFALFIIWRHPFSPQTMHFGHRKLLVCTVKHCEPLKHHLSRQDFIIGSANLVVDWWRVAGLTYSDCKATNGGKFSSCFKQLKMLFFFYTLKSCVSYLENLIKIPDISELYSLKYNVLFCWDKNMGIFVILTSYFSRSV